MSPHSNAVGLTRMLLVLALVLLGLAAVTVWPLIAQSPMTVDGVIETSGGLKYPDGSIQLTAVPRGAPTRSTGVAGCFDQAGVPRDCGGTGEDGESMTGVPFPTPRFTDAGDGTVTDHLTGLIWLKDADCSGELNWQEALTWITTLNTTAVGCDSYAAMTFTDWRLPNVDELRSLVDLGKHTPAMTDGHPFVDVASSGYWSSSTDVQTPASAWSVELGDGLSSTDAKSIDLRAWPVRSGRL